MNVPYPKVVWVTIHLTKMQIAAAVWVLIGVGVGAYTLGKTLAVSQRVQVLEGRGWEVQELRDEVRGIRAKNLEQVATLENIRDQIRSALAAQQQERDRQQQRQAQWLVERNRLLWDQPRQPTPAPAVRHIPAPVHGPTSAPVQAPAADPAADPQNFLFGPPIKDLVKAGGGGRQK
jgi:hypothetical protein